VLPVVFVYLSAAAGLAAAAPRLEVAADAQGVIVIGLARLRLVGITRHERIHRPRRRIFSFRVVYHLLLSFR
jgi:hypothetical protein